MAKGGSAVEKLRRIWTPGREIEELVHRLDPGTELDSMIRDLFHRTIQQKGPQILSMDTANSGTLRWEIIHHEPQNGQVGRREIAIWVEG